MTRPLKLYLVDMKIKKYYILLAFNKRLHMYVVLRDNNTVF